MPSLCQTELLHIEQQLKSLFLKLSNVTQCERDAALRALELHVYHLADRIESLSAASSVLRTGT
jgi:hypothetical protein